MAMATKVKPALLMALQGQRPPGPPPIWLMRQAGRYLPEYRALRAEVDGFLALCYDPARAAEVTLQPIRRFDFDAAILFSDILVVPHALGQDIAFRAGEGPVLGAVTGLGDLAGLQPAKAAAVYAPVLETVARVRDQLPAQKALIGFAGAPWTVATYMVEGGGSKDQAAARRRAFEAADGFFPALIDMLVATTAEYMIAQVRAGADALQIFDSWSGSLAATAFDDWVIAPTKALVTRIRAACPEVPIIGFPKGVGARLADYVSGTGVDAVGLDASLPPAWVGRQLPEGLAVQGNLDPMALLAGGAALQREVEAILQGFADRPHVFNLGHGIVPETPIAHVEDLVAMVRKGSGQ